MFVAECRLSEGVFEKQVTSFDFFCLLRSSSSLRIEEGDRQGPEYLFKCERYAPRRGVVGLVQDMFLK